MELLSNAKTDYLLEATLESLHAESIIWSNEIAFWRDELTFFVRLLGRKEFSKPFPSETAAQMERELIRLNADRLDKIKVGLESHERLLSSAIKSGSISDEQVYRQSHRRILLDMLALQGEIRNFKKALFSFVEKNS
jgi:hypothetical protein